MKEETRYVVKGGNGKYLKGLKLHSRILKTDDSNIYADAIWVDHPTKAKKMKDIRVATTAATVYEGEVLTMVGDELQ